MMTLEELRSNIKWWESKRWIYNVLVGLFGVVAIFNALAESPYRWTLDDTLGLLSGESERIYFILWGL